MERNNLILSAQKLMQVSEQFAQEYSLKKDLLVDEMNKKMMARADLNDLVGANNIEMMKDNNANHARFMESIFYQHSAEVLVHTVLWVFRAYLSRNFNSTYWAALLNGWIEIYKIELTADCFNAVYPYYNWMQIKIPIFVKMAEEKLNSQNSLH